MVNTVIDVALRMFLPLAVVLLLCTVAWVLSLRGRAAIRERISGENRYEHEMNELLDDASVAKVSSAVIEAVSQQFAEFDEPTVLDLLSRYGAESSPEGLDRVHFAILKLSGSSPSAVRANVKLALLDYRDVLYSADSLP